MCTHKAPNRIQLVIGDLKVVSDPNDAVVYAVTLSDPNDARVTGPSGDVTDGSWTMLYDQGFTIETAKHRFVANFKYELKPEYRSEKSLSDLEVYQYERFNSYCYSTMVGTVVYKDSGEFGCFLGEKQNNRISETTE